MFTSRKEAGIRLAQFVAKHHAEAELVVGLPRGGVVVAAEVARLLRVPLDVVVVRKLGHPSHREFAVGAIAEGAVVILDEATICLTGVTPAALDSVIAEETKKLHDYQRRFRRARPVERAGKSVLVVDDGLATGATTEAAVKALQAQQAARVIVAAPVASTTAVERLLRVATDVIALVVDPEFAAVGQYYEDFSQTTDAEVLALLRQSEGEGR